jgi:hypothetical protein
MRHRSETGQVAGAATGRDPDVGPVVHLGEKERAGTSGDAATLALTGAPPGVRFPLPRPSGQSCRAADIPRPVPAKETKA